MLYASCRKLLILVMSCSARSTGGASRPFKQTLKSGVMSVIVELRCALE